MAKDERYANDPEYRERKKAAARAYAAKNKEKRAAAAKAWNEKNREKKAAYNRAYREARPGENYARVKKWREENPEKWKAQREREQRNEEADRARNRRSALAYKKRWPEKNSAQNKLRYAISMGKMKHGEACEECGLPEIFEPGVRFRIHAHHEDYGKPYDVRWLCHGCHNRIHNPPRQS